MKQKPPNPSTVGLHAEEAARRFLEQKGLDHITSNYHCRNGEIDLIMRSGNSILIFVEVRLRNNRNCGSGADTVTPSKQRKISRTALHYLQKHPQYCDYSLRFDVVSGSLHQGRYQFDWIEEAFWPGDN